MVDNSELWIKRAEEMLKKPIVAQHEAASEAVQFATSMLTALYGPESTQLKEFRAGCQAISMQKPGSAHMPFHLCSHAHGAIQNAKAELEAGLIVSLRVGCR